MNKFKLKVIGSSMSPLLENQSDVLIRKQEKYYIGDIVAYWKTKSEITVHRIIRIKDGVIYTKGDANPFADSLATPQSQIIGKVFWMEKSWNKAMYNLRMILKCRLGIYNLKHFQGKKINGNKINLRRIEK